MGDYIKVIVFSLVLATLFYPGLEKLYLYRQTYILEDLVMAPLGFLGENQTILSNDDKFTRYGTNYKELDLLPNRDLFVGIKNEFKFHEKWVNLSVERDRIIEERTATINNYYEKIKNGTYPFIVYGPNTHELDIYFLIYKLQVYLPANSKERGYDDLDNYCEIFLPSTEHRCTLSCKNVLRVFFKDNGACGKIMSGIINYYSDNFYEICRRDEFSANVLLRRVMGTNSFFIQDKCKNGGKLLSDYNSKAFRTNSIVNLLYIFLIIFAFKVFKSKPKLSLYIFLILLILFMPVRMFNDNHISKEYANESKYAYSVFNLPKQLVDLEKSYDAQRMEKANIYKIEPPLDHLTRYGGDFSK